MNTKDFIYPVLLQFFYTALRTFFTLNLILVDPNDALPKKVSKKRKSADTAPKEPEKKPKVEREKQERRRSETKVEVDGQIETHTTLSPRTPPGDPPEPEELIKVIVIYELFHLCLFQFNSFIDTG